MGVAWNSGALYVLPSQKKIFASEEELSLHVATHCTLRPPGPVILSGTFAATKTENLVTSPGYFSCAANPTKSKTMPHVGVVWLLERLQGFDMTVFKMVEQE